MYKFFMTSQTKFGLEACFTEVAIQGDGVFHCYKSMINLLNVSYFNKSSITKMKHISTFSE